MSRWIKITLTLVGITAPVFMLFQNFTYVRVSDLADFTANPCSVEDAAFAILTTATPFTTLESAIAGKPQVERSGTSIQVSRPEATLWVKGKNRGQVAQVQSGDSVQIEMRTPETSRVGRCLLGFASLNGHVVWQQTLDPNRKPASQ